MAIIMEMEKGQGIDGIFYAPPHPSTLNFIHQQVHNLSSNFGQVSEAFRQKAIELHESISGSTAMRLAKAARQAVENIWKTNTVRPLNTLEDYQWAPQIMQRYLMAEPTIRKRYQNQQIEGYEGTYQPAFGSDDKTNGGIGENDYDYRRVMNGVVVETEDGWAATTYMEELLPDDEELDHVDQVIITNAWDGMVRYMQKRKDDPTSRWGASLI